MSNKSKDKGALKQVLVVRKDLKMRKGKIAAQCAHATLAVYRENIGSDKLKFRRWFSSGQTKICVSVDTEDELFEIAQQSKDMGVMFSVITDSGKTEFNGVATNTVICIGPDFEDKIDKITGHLKLL